MIKPITIQSNQPESVAIFRHSKYITKEVKREAKVLEQFVKDVETKFELALFNAPAEITYQDLFAYFLKKWELNCKAISKKRYKHVSINQMHFINKYGPQTWQQK